MYSKEHLRYLKNIKYNNYKIKITQIILIILIIILWQILASLNIINSFITSSPINIIKTIYNLYISSDLFNHIMVTTYETLICFLLAIILSIIISTIFWYNKFIAKVLEPYITILNSLPKVALGPIIIIWAGANSKSIILMSLLISIFVMIINIYEGFKNTDINKINLLKSFKANKNQIYLYVILPRNFKTIISSLKICISMSLIGVIMGELLVSKQGLGYLIMYGSQTFNLDLVMSGIFILCILATIMYYLISFVEQGITKN